MVAMVMLIVDRTERNALTISGIRSRFPAVDLCLGLTRCYARDIDRHIYPGIAYHRTDRDLKSNFVHRKLPSLCGIVHRFLPHIEIRRKQLLVARNILGVEVADVVLRAPSG